MLYIVLLHLESYRKAISGKLLSSGIKSLRLMFLKLIPYKNHTGLAVHDTVLCIELYNIDTE